MEKQTSENWRDDVSDSSNATLKVLDGESATFVFLDEGKFNAHADFGNSVKFEVEHEREKKFLYVKENNYSLLQQVKNLGNVTGMLVKLSRTGKNKSDTRYEIEKVESEEPPIETQPIVDQPQPQQ